MYTDPPQEEVTLAEFEELAMKRLQVLRHVETLRAKQVKPNEMGQAIMESLKKHSLDDSRKDNISHFILRLAYCKSEELRRWMVSQETQVFRARYHMARDSPRELDLFFAENGLDFKPMEVMSEKLRAIVRDLNPHNASDDYFQVPFQEALQLVGKRRIYLKDGIGYVSRRDLVSIVCGRYRQHLSKQLASTFRATHNLRQDQRVDPFVKNLSKQHMGPAFKQSFTGTVTREQIPMLAERSFPLCMHASYKGLRKEHHLKHGGRMQFGLFLKGIGLSLQDAMVFWRNSFARKTPGEAFNKQYAYNIRHNYGKEGKRTSYTPYSCMKIIKSAPPPGEHHGCPFRHFEQGHLEQKLRERRISLVGVEEIMNYVKGMHYQIACQKYFAYTHGGKQGDDVGNHPNSYFDASKRYYLELEKKEKGEDGDDGPAKMVS